MRQAAALEGLDGALPSVLVSADRCRCSYEGAIGARAFFAISVQEAVWLHGYDEVAQKSAILAFLSFSLLRFARIREIDLFRQARGDTSCNPLR